MPRLGHFLFPDLGGVRLTILVAVLLLCSWMQPVHFLPWVSWHSEVLAFVAVGLFASIAVVRQIKKDAGAWIGVPGVALPFFGLALLAVVQAAAGQMVFAGDALVFCFYLALCIAALVLGFGAGANSKDNTSQARVTLEVVAFTLLAGAFASAVLAFAQVLELWEQSAWINRMPQLRRPGGNLGQSNQLATLLLMGVISLMFLYESRKLKALVSVLIFLVLCTALAMTESRTGVLSFLLLCGWWFVKNKRVGFKLSPWVITLSGIGFLAFFWAWPSIFAFVLQISGVDAEVNTKAGMRLVVWPQLLEAVAQRPWWGWGLNQVPQAHNAVAHAYALSDSFSYSHNILLDLALGVGVPLTALLVLATGVWLWRRVRTANSLPPWYCLALVLPVAVHSMLEFPFAYAYFLVPVLFVLGVLEGAAGSKPVFRIGVRSAAALLLGVSALAAWSVVEYVAIEEDFRVARFEALRVGQTPADYQKPDIVLLTQLGALLNGARISPKPGMMVDELALAKKVALRYSWTMTQNRYALSLALNGDPEEAVRQLRVMRAMHDEKTYQQIKANWKDLAHKYPQLLEIKLP